MKHFVVFIVALSFFFEGKAQEQIKVLTLQQCREMAIGNNADNKIAIEKQSAAEYTKKAYKANFFPKLSADGTYLYSNTDFGKTINGGYLPTYITDASGNMTPNINNAATALAGSPVFNTYAFMPDIPLNFSINSIYTANLKLEQPIYMGGKISAAYKMASIGQDVANMSKNLSKSDIILKVDDAYWTLVKTQQLKLSAEKYKEVIEELLRNVSNAVNVGMKHRKDLLSVQVKLNEAKLNLKRAENGIVLAKMNLCHVVGLPLNQNIGVSDDFEETSLNEVAQYNSSDRIEYKMLDKQIEAKSYEVKLARSEFLPNIGVMAIYGYMNGIKLNNDKLFNDESFAAMVSVKIPIFHWREGYNKVQAAKSAKRIAELQLTNTQQLIELETKQAENAVDEATLEVSLTESALEQAKENLVVSQNQYDKGMETLANLLEAQTIWQKAEADNISAKTSLALCITKLKKATGKL